MNVRGGLSLRDGQGRVRGKGCDVSRGQTGLLPRVGNFTGCGSGVSPPISIASNSTCNGPCGMARALRCGTGFKLRLRVPLCGRALCAALSVTGAVSRVGHLSCKGTERSLVLRVDRVCCLKRIATRRVVLVGTGVAHLRRLESVARTFCSGNVTVRMSIGHIGVGLRGLGIRRSGTRTVVRRRLGLLGCVVSCPTRREVTLMPIGARAVAPTTLAKLSRALCRLRLLRSRGRLTRRRGAVVDGNCVPSLGLAKD